MFTHQLNKFGPFGLFILRLAFGIVFFMHGAQKLFGWFDGPGISGVTGFLGSLGFAPAAAWAWLLALVEFVGGILLMVGLFTSIAALLIAIDMLVALVKVHLANGFFVSNGGFEFVLILFAVALFFATHSAGAWSLEALWHRKKIQSSPPPMSTT